VVLRTELRIFAIGSPYFSHVVKSIMVTIFWVSLCILVYCYLGYAIIATVLIYIRRLFIKKRNVYNDLLIPVTIVVSAYNEGKVLESKISNILALDYPPELLNIIFVIDGSSDNSAAVIGKYPSIQLIHQPERQGKYAAIRRAMNQVTTPVVVFSDANTTLNSQALKRMVRHYADEKVGGVAGEKKILLKGNISAVGKAEGLYWKYESFMKRIDASLFTVVGAAGELFSIRTNLFLPTETDMILDDLLISMKICVKGYRIAYEPKAFSTELPSASIGEEEKRKVRIAAGAYQSITRLLPALNFIHRPVLAFQYVSRRLFRWVLGPFLLPVVFCSNFLIVSSLQHGIFYEIFLFGQILLYVMAFAGALLNRRSNTPGVFTIPFYFIFMNYCLLKGFSRYLNKDQSVLWEKSLRQAVE
jgi:biofilm PGA synthesis N-glycosyltransferase PgaC